MSCYNRYRKKKKHGKKRKCKKKVVQTSRKKRGQIPKHTSKRCNCHHLCWQKKCWKNRWARAFREFWYCKVDIPAETIHRYIHEVMVEIPVPNEVTCEHALKNLIRLDRKGLLHPDDPPTKRLGILICLLGGGCREAGLALEQQRAIFEEWEKQLGNPTDE